MKHLSLFILFALATIPNVYAVERTHDEAVTAEICGINVVNNTFSTSYEVYGGKGTETYSELWEAANQIAARVSEGQCKTSSCAYLTTFDERGRTHEVLMNKKVIYSASSSGEGLQAIHELRKRGACPKGSEYL